MSEQRKGGARTAPRKTEKKPAKKGPKRTGTARVLYYAYITLTVISAFIVLGYVVFNLLSAPPEPTPIYTRPPVVVTTEDQEGNVVVTEIPGLSDDRKEQFYTFLLVGQSQVTGGSLTDTMMLVAYDVPNQKLSIMSLPRDTYVNYNGRNVLLNTIYTSAGGSKGHDAANTALKREVSELTGVYPDWTVVVRWEAVGELVDAIGGVYYEVPRNMNYDDPTQDLHIHVKKGYQLLDGDLAMQVIRWRHDNYNPETGSMPGYADGDLGRIRTQQGFLKAVIKKCLQPDVLLSNLGDYITIFQNNVVTDLGVGDMTYFVKSAVNGLNLDDVTFVTLPYKDAGDGAHLLAVPEKVLEVVNEHFNPYMEDLTLGELDIVTSLPKASKKPTPTPSATPKPSNSPEPSGSPSAEPSASPKPSASAKPTASPKPTGEGEGPILPTDSPAPSPAQSEAPPPSHEPDPTVAPTPEPPAPTPEPPTEPTVHPTPPPDDGPMLPGA